MIVLGIDPGSLHTGYGLIEAERGGERLITCGVLHFSGDDDHQLRLKQIYDGLSTIVEEHLPDECAVEMPVYGHNPQSLLKLARAQSAAMLVALNRGIPVAQYTPAAVKKSATGLGNATKEQVYRMIASVLKLDARVGYDASDALAVALCHAHRVAGGAPSAGKVTDWAAFVKANPGRIKG